jgi:mono/diheme cytochrome c family protein
MPAKQLKGAIGWIPHVVVIFGALALTLIVGPPKSNPRAWRPSARVPAGFVEMQPETLSWKQPILPAQYAQGSCGTCHRADLPETPRLNHGRQLIVRLNCIGCHRFQDIDRQTMLGPDLTNVGNKVSREWIYKWLKDPRTITDTNGNVTVDGVAMEPRMPKFQLNDIELRALSAYLSMQHAKPMGARKLTSVRTAASAGDKEAAEQGHSSFNQLFCVTCHALAVDRGGETTLIGGDIGPELTKVGSKVKPEWLVAWLRDPQNYLEHTGMPRYEWTDRNLYKVARYVLAQLTDPDLLKDVPQLGAPTAEEFKCGQRLFVDKGCAECHVIQGVIPRSDFGPDLSALGMAAGPFVVEVRSTSSLSAPLHFVSSDVKHLHIGVSKIPRSMITYLQAKITDPASVTPETHMPKFHLSQTDLDDLITALLSMSGPSISGEGQNHLIIERSHNEFHPDGDMGRLYHQFKCYQCHKFNGDGGTLAPDLSYEGSRSQHQWLVEFLVNPQTIRPTLTARMPRFNMSKGDATTIADYLSSKLQSPNVHPEATNEKKFTAEMAEQGKRLFEEKYKCQSCHTIGSSGGYVGPSLNNAGNWLTPAWIEAWLEDPQALVPGAIEPRQSFNADEKTDLTAYLMTLKQNRGDKSSTAEVATGGQ